MQYRTVYRESSFERASRRVGLFLLAPLLLILSLAVILGIAQKPELGLTVHRLEVVSVAPGGPAARAGLLPGDRITGIDGILLPDMVRYYAALAGRQTMVPISFLIQRGNRTHHLVLYPVPPTQALLIRNYSIWVVGLAFLMIGWWVLAKRHDPVARNFFALCLIFAFLLLEIPDRPQFSYMWVKEHLWSLLQVLLPAYFLRFFLQFPSLRRTTDGEAAKLRLLLIPGWALFLLSLVVEQILPGSARKPMQTLLELVVLVYMLGFFVAGLVIFARRALRKDRPIQRSKMRVILIGLIAGLVPFLASALVGNLAPGSALPHWQYLAFSLLLVPASFGLAIMRFGALDRDFVIRTSLIYGLMTALVLLAYFLIVLGSSWIFDHWLGVDSDRLVLVLVAVSGLLILPLRRLAQGWIDKAFYPARRANRRALAALGAELTGMIDTAAVVLRLKQGLDCLFRPRSQNLYLLAVSDPGAFLPWSPAGAAPVPPEGPVALPAGSGLALLLNRLRRPIFSEEAEDLLMGQGSDPVSVSLLTRLEAQLFVPLITGNQLLGFISLGEKKGGSLYSQEDLANLQALAVQAGPLIESRQLYQDSLRQKRLETEMQLAREIQASLLPTAALQGPGFAISGRNESCRMVGGDFFDYFRRPDGALGFAIGDVSGKGIPAALLMSSLKVAFRAEAESAPTAREVILHLNRTVCGLVSQGRFVSFFFGIWDPAAGILNYCNAGMDPPVVLRRGRSFRQALRRGGMVLGVERDHPYREGNLPLEAGDCVFLYTDGLTEARNPDGEFFDAPRLWDLVQESLDLDPDGLLERIFCRVEEFGGGEKSDDKTAIILKLNEL